MGNKEKLIAAIERDTLRRELEALGQRYDLGARELSRLQAERESVDRAAADGVEALRTTEATVAQRASDLDAFLDATKLTPRGDGFSGALWEAAVVAQVGRSIPPFEHHRGPMRWLARLMTRCVNFLARPITNDQRVVNNELLRIASQLAYRVEGQALEIQRLRLSAVENRGRALESRLAAWESNETVTEVSQSVERVALTAAASRNRELEEQLERSLDGQNERLVTLEDELHGLRGELSEGKESFEAQSRRLTDRMEAFEQAQRPARQIQTSNRWHGNGNDGNASRITGSLELDRLYADFEARFRGTREDVRGRLEEYIPVVEDCSTVDPDHPLADIGTGRGEWLELLRDRGIPAIGVEQNAVFVDLCETLGLHVLETEAVSHLMAIAPSSYGAITAFHLIEHLPPDHVIPFLEQCQRVLAQDGLLILETPNPANLRVGATTFYSDPTHHRPIPSETLLFLLQRLGFERVERILPKQGREPLGRLAPLDESEEGAGKWNPVVELLNSTLGVPPDYAVIARRAN